MKIAHIVSTYPPYYGGMGNVVFQTASALANRGHEVEVFTPLFDNTQKPAQEDVAYARRLTPSFSYGNAARLPEIQHTLGDFDIVHLHYPFFGTANLVRKWKKDHPDRPLVITYHMDPRAPSWKGLVFKLYTKWWMPKILAAADRCIASSFDYLEASDAASIYIADKEKWREIPFGVDTDRFFPAAKQPDAFHELNLDVSVPTLVFVGGMDAAHYFKGIPELLMAIGMLKKAGVPLQALLVGDGDLRPQFEQKAAAYDITDRVRFLGKVSDEVLPYVYQMADISVLPSTHKNEAFGMVLLESMASGVPVIASDIPGVRSVAQHAGIVVPPKNPEALADAITGYFLPDTDRASWQQQARTAAETYFSWDHIVGELEQVYTELVRDRS